MTASPHSRCGYGFLLCGTVLLAASLPARAEWLFDAEAAAFYDDNLSRASQAVDVHSGAAATLVAGARSLSVLDASDTLVIGGAMGGEVFDRYHGLDNGSVTGTATYRHKVGIGFAAPWVLCEAAAGYFDYDFNVRTGARFALRAEAGKRFSESLDAEIGAFYDRRYGPYGVPDIPGISGQVFSLRGQGAYVRAGYSVTEDVLVSAKLAVRRGDVVSTSFENAQVLSAATAIAEDPTFGADLYDYRLRGTTWTAAVTMSWAVDDRSSLNLGYTGESTSATAGLGYRSNSVVLTYSYRY